MLVSILFELETKLEGVESELKFSKICNWYNNIIDYILH